MELEWFFVYGLLPEITSTHPGDFLQVLEMAGLIRLAAIAIVASLSCIDTSRNQMPEPKQPTRKSSIAPMTW